MTKKHKEPSCDVCGAEPEFWLGKGSSGRGGTRIYHEGPDRTRFLCGEHREEWFIFNRENRKLFATLNGLKGKAWAIQWEKIYNVFVQEAKGEIILCPYCSYPMPKMMEEKR